MLIEVWASLGFAGEKYKDTLEVGDDLTDEQIAEEARASIPFEWQWKKLEDVKTKRDVLEKKEVIL